MALGGADVIDAYGLQAGAVRADAERRSGQRRAHRQRRATTYSMAAMATTLALMGAGDDTFVWNPGDDNDIVEGQAGFDTLLFNGANAGGEHRHLGHRRARSVLPRCCYRHYGLERCRAHRVQRAGRRGQHHRQRSSRHGCDARLRINLAASGGGAMHSPTLSSRIGNQRR